VILFILGLIYSTKDNLHTKRWFLYAALWTIPLAWLASEAGWLVNEMGRQPWVIQNLMPTRAALSNISSTSVMITFFLFGVTFTILMIAEIRIMLKQIKQLNDGGH
jgi:cytochrome d ubiquinol oxidase subunit I